MMGSKKAGSWVDGKLIEKAKKDKVTLVFDRYRAQQPQCPFGSGGACCTICHNGPCRIIPGKADKGVCGADADVIVARNWVRHTAAGTNAHSDHAKEAAGVLLKVAEGKTKAYTIKDEKKLRAFAKKLKVRSTGPVKQVAKAVALKAMEDFRRQEDFDIKEGESMNWVKLHASKERIETWRKLGILPMNPDHETSRALHQTHMGCDADPVHLLLTALKLGIADGYGGLHMATDMQDILFGTPMLTQSMADLGVLKDDYVNIAVHGHVPLLSDKVVEWARKLDKQAKGYGAKGINVIGVCCTGNEVLMRHGIPLAAHEMQQEMVIATGACEAMVVDTQCIYPSVQDVASCYHTKLITTLDFVRIPGATHIPFHAESADKAAKEIVMTGVRNFRNRPTSVYIPKKKVEVWAGCTPEMIIAALSKVDKKDPLKPLIDNIANGNIRGVAALVGCRNPKLRGKKFGERMMKILLRNNVLVVTTGCMAHAAAQDGLMNPHAVKKHAGKKLAAVLTAIGKANGLPGPIPPVLHMGSCVDNGRIETVLNAVSAKLGVPIHRLPVVASAPEYVTEKAVAIGTWALALGVTTHVNPVPPVTGSELVTRVFTKDLEGITGGKVLIGTTPEDAAKAMIKHIDDRRKGLGLPVKGRIMLDVSD
jgi:carbon-monoxide dehydrogenase catalytic subunit